MNAMYVSFKKQSAQKNRARVSRFPSAAGAAFPRPPALAIAIAVEVPLTVMATFSYPQA
jgi:hypothetical protein